MARTHVALLRGINVGTAKRVAMADLRALLASLGYSDVTTVLNSGNAVFGAARGSEASHAAKIERGVVTRLGVSSRVTVLTLRELQTILRENPLARAGRPTNRLHISVLASPADRSHASTLARQRWGDESIALGKRVAYLWCPNGLSHSPMAEAVFKVLDDRVTTRNVATMEKLCALSGA